MAHKTVTMVADASLSLSWTADQDYEVIEAYCGGLLSLDPGLVATTFYTGPSVLENLLGSNYAPYHATGFQLRKGEIVYFSANYSGAFAFLHLNPIA